MVGIIGVVTPTVAMDLVPGIIIGVTTPPVAVAARATIVSRTADQDRVRTVAPVHANAVIVAMGAVIVTMGAVRDLVMGAVRDVTMGAVRDVAMGAVRNVVMGAVIVATGVILEVIMVVVDTSQHNHLRLL